MGLTIYIYIGLKQSSFIQYQRDILTYTVGQIMTTENEPTFKKMPPF